MGFLAIFLRFWLMKGKTAPFLDFSTPHAAGLVAEGEGGMLLAPAAWGVALECRHLFTAIGRGDASEQGWREQYFAQISSRTHQEKPLGT